MIKRFLIIAVIPAALLLAAFSAEQVVAASVYDNVITTVDDLYISNSSTSAYCGKNNVSISWYGIIEDYAAQGDPSVIDFKDQLKAKLDNGDTKGWAVVQTGDGVTIPGSSELSYSFSVYLFDKDIYLNFPSESDAQAGQKYLSARPSRFTALLSIELNSDCTTYSSTSSQFTGKIHSNYTMASSSIFFLTGNINYPSGYEGEIPPSEYAPPP